MLPPSTTSTLFPYTTLFRSMMPLIALVTDMSGVCSAGDTLQITCHPTKQARMKTVKWSVSPALHTPLMRSEEHTSELQSQSNLVCRLLLEKKKRQKHAHPGR